MYPSKPKEFVKSYITQSEDMLLALVNREDIRKVLIMGLTKAMQSQLILESDKLKLYDVKVILERWK